MGKTAAELVEQGIEDLEPRPIASTTMPALVKAIAFATIAYWIDVYLDGLTDWDASLTHSIGGWIARAAMEGAAINAQGKALEGVCWSPLDDSETAAELVEFLKGYGATNDLGVAYARASAELERDKTAPVPGWGSIETLLACRPR